MNTPKDIGAMIMFNPTDAAYVMLRAVTSSSFVVECERKFVVNLPYERSSSMRRNLSSRLANAEFDVREGGDP
jgi:hypothetical protein